MKFLFVTVYGESLALMQALQDEGHEVRYFVKDLKFRDVGRGILAQTRDWKKYIDWADVTVFDDAGCGKDCEKLRARGYLTVGGNSFGDRLENERLFGQKIMREAGIKFPASRRFKSFVTAIRFIENNPGRYVAKFNGQLSRYLSYIGRSKDGSDLINILDHHLEKWPLNKKIDFILQKYINGVEMASGAFFNGKNFVYPVNITFEHKHFLAGGIGPLTPEMGTTEFYTKDGGKLFRETLLKMEPFLARTNYRGFIDLNCMVTPRGAYALEFTTRFGYPQLDIQLELHKSKWGELLHQLAEGSLKNFDVYYDYAIGVVLSGAGVPFEVAYNKYGRGLPIFGVTKENQANLRLSEVYIKDGNYYCAGAGYPITVTGRGRTVGEAQKGVYKIIEEIVIPNCVYRVDIGDHWRIEEIKLKEWGYL